MEPDVPREIYQTNVSTTPSCRSEHWLDHHDARHQIKHRRQLRKQPARVPKPIPRSDGRFRVARAFFVATLPSVVVTGGRTCRRNLTSYVSVVALLAKRLRWAFGIAD